MFIIKQTVAAQTWVGRESWTGRRKKKDPLHAASSGENKRFSHGFACGIRLCKSVFFCENPCLHRKTQIYTIESRKPVTESHAVALARGGLALAVGEEVWAYLSDVLVECPKY